MRISLIMPVDYDRPELGRKQQEIIADTGDTVELRDSLPGPFMTMRIGSDGLTIDIATRPRAGHGPDVPSLHVVRQVVIGSRL